MDLAIVYKQSKFLKILTAIGGITYVWAPELLHGMGIVYWHQSIMQVTLLLQIILYYRYAIEGSRNCKIAFYILALINPYIEWTGYVANLGFAMSDLLINRTSGKKEILKKVLFLGLLSIASFGVFSLYYLLRVDMAEFLMALKSRFMARNVTTSIALTDVIGGCLKSFLYLWLLFIILVIWCFVRCRSIQIKYGILLLAMAFPIIENVIMKEHALIYTYDRMNAIFLLSFLICEIARNILEATQGRTEKTILVMAGILSALNLNSYIRDKSYIWKVDYREK